MLRSGWIPKTVANLFASVFLILLAQASFMRTKPKTQVSEDPCSQTGFEIYVRCDCNIQSVYSFIPLGLLDCDCAESRSPEFLF